MAYEQKDNSGSLFVNDRKESDNHPDYNGSIMVDGKVYWLSAWKKKSKDGNPYLSIALKPKEGGQQRKPYGSHRSNQDDFL